MSESGAMDGRSEEGKLLKEEVGVLVVGRGIDICDIEFDVRSGGGEMEGEQEGAVDMGR